MILIAYLIVSLTVLLVLISSRQASATSRNSLYSWLSVINSAAYLVITAVLIAARTAISNRYFIVDSLSTYEVLVASIVFLLASTYARGYVNGLLKMGEIDPAELKLFYVALNALFGVVVYAFFSNNMALFWILLEVTTLLSSALIVTLNAKENIMAALKYVFTTSTAMLFSIVGLIILFAISKQMNGEGTLNWTLLMQQAGSMTPQLFALAFVLIFVGFAAKTGIVPFHTWLPQAHAKAPSVISVLLSAALLNAGTYGILRMYAVARQTEAEQFISTLLIVFGVLSIAVAAFSMLPRSNIKKLIAFSSIEHMGFAMLGIGLGTPLVIFWVLFHRSCPCKDAAFLLCRYSTPAVPRQQIRKDGRCPVFPTFRFLVLYFRESCGYRHASVPHLRSQTICPAAAGGILDATAVRRISALPDSGGCLRQHLNPDLPAKERS